MPNETYEKISLRYKVITESPIILHPGYYNATVESVQIQNNGMMEITMLIDKEKQ